jgi:hypothetical protein
VSTTAASRFGFAESFLHQLHDIGKFHESSEARDVLFAVVFHGMYGRSRTGGSASGPISRPFSLTCKMHHSYRENYSRTLLCVRDLHGRGLLLFLCIHNKRSRPNSPSTPPVAPHRAVLPDTLCGFGLYVGNGRSSKPRCLRSRFHARYAWSVEVLAKCCHRYTSRRDGKGTGYHARPIAAYPSSNGLRYS